MDITYLGHASFKLRGKDASVVTDPYGAMVQTPYPNVSAEMVTVSHDHEDHNAVSRVKGTSQRPKPLVIDAPGEYEAHGISVFGVGSFHDEKQGEERGRNTIFVIHVDEVVVAHLGDLGEMLTKQHEEALSNVDVLLLPVGGTYTIDAKQAAEVVERVDPLIVIPMHYKVAGLGKVFENLTTVDEFLEAVGARGARREKKLTLAKGALPEEREVVVMERS
ncbi:MAG: MBL fold metallo-hydrolase [Candidatus Chisholmbacteria bacterium]|nr:MBL fold metallo-hydrolase [Candidatus Chisholmbacteria bacterium]